MKHARCSRHIHVHTQDRVRRLEINPSRIKRDPFSNKNSRLFITFSSPVFENHKSWSSIRTFADRENPRHLFLGQALFIKDRQLDGKFPNRFLGMQGKEMGCHVARWSIGNRASGIDLFSDNLGPL